ncbi:MAG: hypothetical protein ABI794_09905 [Betaproteobacteria bacterium]
MIEKSKVTGVAIATAAAAMFLAGCQSSGNGVLQSADSSSAAMKCFGSNACKGQGECKTAMNACKGQNECKGHGFLKMTEKACAEHFGRT